MSKYTLKDFQIGDNVYHLSNTKLKMVIIKILPDINEVSCRWIDAKGEKQVADFFPEELGKVSDLGPRVMSLY